MAAAISGAMTALMLAGDLENQPAAKLMRRIHDIHDNEPGGEALCDHGIEVENGFPAT